MFHVVFITFPKNCPYYRGYLLVIIVLRWCAWHPLYGVAGCPYARGCNSIEFNDRSVGTVATVHYTVDVRNSGVSGKRGFTVHTFNVYNYNHSLYVMEIPVVGDIYSVFVFLFDGVG